ncbi:hypothetical protein PR048_028665 [Dryococelus australis]|uniref:PiggyBac transposable element-derived protein domain-containing protein n=1 Tax=Dryococelus australis TaxID=614101 RepID=A0ABQ9GBV7_9NEOP|nr:hypothetical protein PR048_028665 [Dryococelus australis]
MPVGAFSRRSPVTPTPPSFQRNSIFTSLTLIGSQDLAFKRRPNLYTHSRIKNNNVDVFFLLMVNHGASTARGVRGQRMKGRGGENRVAYSVSLKAIRQLPGLKAVRILCREIQGKSFKRGPVGFHPAACPRPCHSQLLVSSAHLPRGQWRPLPAPTLVSIHGTGRNLTMYSWFMLVPLADVMLKDYNITVVGILRKNKREISPSFLPSRKTQVGSSQFAFESNKMLVSFCPKKGKSVLMLSTLHYKKNNSRMQSRVKHTKPLEIRGSQRDSHRGIKTSERPKAIPSSLRILSQLPPTSPSHLTWTFRPAEAGSRVVTQGLSSSRSPDLIPIEHLWNELETRVRKYEITSKTRLKEILLQGWRNMKAETTKTLVHPQRTAYEVSVTLLLPCDWLTKPSPPRPDLLEQGRDLRPLRGEFT